jgi:hypothetical protein
MGAFLTGSGPVEIDRHTLAYHRSIRALEELVDFALEVLAPDPHAAATRETSYRFRRGATWPRRSNRGRAASLQEVGALASTPTYDPTR